MMKTCYQPAFHTISNMDILKSIPVAPVQKHETNCSYSSNVIADWEPFVHIWKSNVVSI